MTHPKKIQSETNGPLSKEFRERIGVIKEKKNMTLAELGNEIGFSGAFVSQILNDRNPARVRSKHVARIEAAIERLETETGPSLQPQSAPEPSVAISAPENFDLAVLIRAAHHHGFAVEFKPLGR